MKKKNIMRKILTILLLAVITASLLSGCGLRPRMPRSAKTAEDKGQSMEEWVDANKARFVAAMHDDKFKGSMIAVDDKTVCFQFTLKEQIPLDSTDQADINERFDTAFDSQEFFIKIVKDLLLRETGIDDAVMRIEFLNADGSLIYSRDFAD